MTAVRAFLTFARRLACFLYGHSYDYGFVGEYLPQRWSKVICRTCGATIDAFRRPS